MTDQILSELRLIRSEQLAQAVMLGRVDERTLALDEKIDSHLASDTAFHGDMEQRIRPLERFKIKAAAMIATMAFIGSVVVGMAKEALASVFLHH